MSAPVPPYPPVPPGSYPGSSGNLPLSAQRWQQHDPHLLAQFPSSPLPPAYFARKLARNVYWKDKMIYVDGYRFEDCRFDNCQIIVRSANFEFVRCMLDKHCMINYADNTQKIVQLFLNRHDPNIPIPPHFYAQNFADGSMTIEDWK